MATYGELITRVMTRLSAMGGLDVQTYMQPKIAEMIRYRYDQIFLKRFWRQATLADGFTITELGKPTGLFVPPLTRFIDIQYIIPDGYSRPLPEMRRNRTGHMQQELCYAPANDGDGHVFRIIPANSSMPQSYDLMYRSRQTSWTETDEINLDDQLMILGVCADYSVGEGANMEMAQSFAAMYADRMRELEYAEVQHEKSKYGGDHPGLYQWH